MTDEIHFDDDEINAANSWHGGGGSMLYAIASTGVLRRGIHRPSIRGRALSDEEWFRHLAEQLEDEANEAARHAGTDAKKAKGAEKKELLADKRALQSIALKAARVNARVSHATKYGEKTSEKVARTMREFKEGKLRSGSGSKVTSREQAIAIGLSQARARGYKVPSASAHSTKKSTQLDREIADVTGLRDGWTKVRVRAGWPETWDKYLRAWWYTVEKQPNGRWAVGSSHHRGDPDSIDRGGTFATWEAATKFAEEHAR